MAYRNISGDETSVLEQENVHCKWSSLRSPGWVCLLSLGVRLSNPVLGSDNLKDFYTHFFFFPTAIPMQYLNIHNIFDV